MLPSLDLVQSGWQHTPSRQNREVDWGQILIDRELAADSAVAVSRRPKLQVAIPDVRAPLPYSDYLIQQHLGTGGMGKVYRAMQRSLDRPVAVKALLKSRLSNPRAVEQFLQEARIVGSLRHPNIVGVHGLGRFPGGGYFLVMDFVQGEDIAAKLRGGPVSIADAVKITADVAGAIHYAHQQGVIHCDLKPANVLVERSGRVYVVDFGLAALVKCAPSVVDGGTHGFLAPEVAASSCEPTVAIDVFGLGALLYALLTGKPPHERASPLLLPPTMPEWVRAVCARCLDPEPLNRFASAFDVQQGLAMRI